MKALSIATVLAVAFAAAAFAQDQTPGAPPPVESMSCEQMQAELIVAGQRMNAQLDPEFTTEAQAMQREQEEAYARARRQMAAGVGMGIACSIPGVGMACMAGQAAQAAQAQSEADQNIARMQAQHDRLQQSMTGLDQQRMLQLTQRFEDQNCQTPQ